MFALPVLHDIPQWLTATVSTVVGAAFGVASALWIDEIKVRRTDRQARQRLQRAIYKELAIQHVLISDLIHEATQIPLQRQQEGTAAILKKTRFDAYQFAKTQPGLFYELKDAMVIDALYSHLHHAVEHERVSPTTTIAVCQQFIQSLEDSVLRGDIDLGSMSEAAPDAYKHFSDLRSQALAAKH